jgi:hypothetical protein
MKCKYLVICRNFSHSRLCTNPVRNPHKRTDVDCIKSKECNDCKADCNNKIGEECVPGYLGRLLTKNIVRVQNCVYFEPEIIMGDQCKHYKYDLPAYKNFKHCCVVHNGVIECTFPCKWENAEKRCKFYEVEKEIDTSWRCRYHIGIVSLNEKRCWLTNGECYGKNYCYNFKDILNKEPIMGNQCKHYELNKDKESKCKMTCKDCPFPLKSGYGYYLWKLASKICKYYEVNESSELPEWLKKIIKKKIENIEEDLDGSSGPLRLASEYKKSGLEWVLDLKKPKDE